MRDIKFRGKSVIEIEELDDLGIEHKNGWITGNLVMFGDEPFIVGDFIEVDHEYTINEFWAKAHPESVGQYIFKKCSEGKEIYEGDMLEYKIANVYEDHKYIRIVGKIEEGHKPPVGFIQGVKIIGNAFDTSELLEGAQND